MSNKIHFIGIGGIGMSALARYYASLNYKVSGSDVKESEITKLLTENNISVSIGQKASNVPDGVWLVIYTVAIDSDNPELVRAMELGVHIKTYAQALGEISKNKKVIAISGSHGKTTTTAMTYFALKEAGINPSMIVGSLIEIDGHKTNYVYGDSEYIIIEACEYRRSFLNYNPEIILITNIDNDHLDYFKDIKEIEETFQEFVDKLPSEGALITHGIEFNKMNFQNKINADLSSVSLEEIKLSVPGEHNKKNAQLVLALGDFLKLDRNLVLLGLEKFKGTWRRQEFKGNFFEMDFYTDYAHHPTEIRETIKAFKSKIKDSKTQICVVFQPHLFSRTKILFDDFVQALSMADEIILLPIYAAREKFDPSMSSEMLMQDLKNLKNKKVTLLETVNSVKDFLQINSNKNKIILTLGAGDINDLYDII